MFSSYVQVTASRPQNAGTASHLNLFLGLAGEELSLDDDWLLGDVSRAEQLEVSLRRVEKYMTLDDISNDLVHRNHGQLVFQKCTINRITA